MSARGWTLGDRVRTTDGGAITRPEGEIVGFDKVRDLHVAIVRVREGGVTFDRVYALDDLEYAFAARDRATNGEGPDAHYHSDGEACFCDAGVELAEDDEECAHGIGSCETCTPSSARDELIDRDCGVPANLLPGLERYVLEAIETGGFLRAVLENDLAGAILRGDPESIAAIPAILTWLTLHAPLAIWGSREKVAKHLAGRTPARLPECFSANCGATLNPANGGEALARCHRPSGHPGTHTGTLADGNDRTWCPIGCTCPACPAGSRP